MRRVDTWLENRLVVGQEEEDYYEEQFGTTLLLAGVEDTIELPQDYKFPLAMIFADGEILLIWLKTQELMDEWAAILTKLIARRENGKLASVEYLIRNADNHFTMTLYKCMVKKPKPA